MAGYTDGGAGGGMGDTFDKFVIALRRRLGDKVMTSWMTDLRIENLTQDTVTISTESQLKCDTIGQRYAPQMRDAWCEAVGPIRSINIVTRRKLSAGAAKVDSLKPSASNGRLNGHAVNGHAVNGHAANGVAVENTRSAGDERAPTLEDLRQPIDERMTFDNYAVDATNEVAFAAARQVFTATAPEIVYLYGKSGVGKTHLLFAIGNEHKRRNGAGGSAYLTYNAMQSGWVNAVFTNGVHSLHRDLLANDVVLIDDIHQLLSSPRTQAEILNLVNAFIASGRRLVVAGEMSPQKLAAAGMNARLCDRLVGGLSVAVQPADAALRLRVLQMKARNDVLECRFEDGALDYIAENFKGTMREALGAYHQLRAAFSEKPVTIGREEAAAALRGRLGEHRRPATLEDAVRVTAHVFGIPEAELKGRGQHQRLARARHAFVIVCREFLRESFPRIARQLGRDHTTAMSGYKRGHALQERDKGFASAIAAIREQLEAPQG